MANNKNSPSSEPESEPSSKSGARSDVIDAEIIEGPSDGDEASPQAETAKIVEETPVMKQKSSKAGWISAGFLATFIGGVFAAPYGESGLRTIGILAPVAPALGGTVPDRATQERFTALESQMSALGVSVSQFQELLAQHSAQLNEATEARKQIGDDVALIAGQPGQINADTDANAQTVQQLETRLAAVTDEVARLAALSGSDDPEITGLTGSIALARAETNQLKAKLALLEAAMTQMQAGALDVSPRGRLLLVLGRLKDRALEGAALGGELDAIRLDIAELPALDQQLIGADVAVLAANQQGIEPFENLTRSFDAAASAAKKAQEKADGSLLASLFTVRRTDENAVGIDAVLLAAEKRLAARDLEGALAALAELPSGGAEAITDWKQKAGAHRDVLAAFDRLLRRISASTIGDAR